MSVELGVTHHVPISGNICSATWSISVRSIYSFQLNLSSRQGTSLLFGIENMGKSTLQRRVELQARLDKLAYQERLAAAKARSKFQAQFLKLSDAAARAAGLDLVSLGADQIREALRSGFGTLADAMSLAEGAAIEQGQTAKIVAKSDD